MAETAVFYRLTHKFVSGQQSIPDGPRQLIYYSLAIGHHVGVMDCFHRFLEVPLEDYRTWLEHVPEGAARHKLEGVLKWGEIEVNCTHAGELLPVLKAALPHMNPAHADWARVLIEYLQQMAQEPALYLMIRKSS